MLFFGAGNINANPQAFDFFEKKIRPVLVANCYECHSPESEKIESDFLLNTREGIRKGGATGRDSIIPGDVESSQLIGAIRYDDENLQMPPEGMLPEAVIRDFEKWVEMEAPDPRDGRSRLPREIEAESHWSFQPLKKPEQPDVKDKSWPRDRIDFFSLARMEEAEVRPVADAGRSTLIRRVSIELAGLPPTMEEVNDYVKDPASDREAFEKVVDRLMKSQGFGERWGRHWLDVARYAESSGYTRNMLYPYAWRYRDWVIEALNKDMPYDEFVTKQIAGDLLPFDSLEQRDDQRISTAFLTIGPKTLNEGVPLLFELNVADDQIDATCRAFLALTANCSRCHDHKYDPIPTRDYYALTGIFRSTHHLAATETNVRFEHGQARPIGKDGEKLHLEIEEATKKKDGIQVKYLAAVKVRNECRDSLKEKGVDWEKNPTPELEEAEKEFRKFYDMVQAAQKAIPDPPNYAMSVKDARILDEEKWKAEFEKNSKEKKPTYPRIQNSPLFEKGVHNSPKDEVPRGVLTLFDDQFSAPPISDNESGRLQLAEWLTDEKNPLTSRVIVNRVWHHLFGIGLVDTVDNFGLLGSKPSHPELLDDLAIEFMEDGWSVKRLIKRILLSRTWQLSSAVDEKAQKADPDGRLRWRFTPQRLEGEVIRDVILFTGGNLDQKPPNGSQVLDVALTQPKKQQREIGRRDYYTKDVDQTVKYRSVYLPMARGGIFDVLKVFDAPDPNLVVGARKLTTVPSQALFLMNSELATEQAASLAGLVLGNSKDLNAQIDFVFQRIFSRLPDGSERQTVKNFFEGSPPTEELWAQAVQAMYCSGEFRTLY